MAEINGRCTFEIKESVSKKGGKYSHIVFRIGEYELSRDSKGAPFFLTSDQILLIQMNSKKNV